MQPSTTPGVWSPGAPLHCAACGHQLSSPKPSASREQRRCSARSNSGIRLRDAMVDFLSFVFSGQQAPIWLFRFSRVSPHRARNPRATVSNRVVNDNNSNIQHTKFWSRATRTHREIGSSKFWSLTHGETLCYSTLRRRRSTRAMRGLGHVESIA